MDRAELCFSEASGTPTMGRPLEEALRQLIRKAKNSIIICSCEFTGSKNFILNEEITIQLKKGKSVIVYGNDGSQMRNLMATYGDLGLKAFRWVPPRKKSLFHIKAIMVDENMVYMGSANLSLNAMQNSAEWGLISHSPEICRDLTNYIQELKKLGRFTEVE